MGTDIFEQTAAYVLRIEESLSYPDKGGNKFLQKVDTCQTTRRHIIIIIIIFVVTTLGTSSVIKFRLTREVILGFCRKRFLIRLSDWLTVNIFTNHS
jgi:hypothetical protein